MATNSRSRFSALATASLLVVNLGLIGLGSALPARAGQNANDAWRASWKKKWIARLEAQQKAKEKSISNSGASPPAAAVSASPSAVAKPIIKAASANVTPIVPLVASPRPSSPAPTAGTASKTNASVPAASSVPVSAQAVKPVSAAAPIPNYLAQTKPDIFSSDTAKPELSKSGSGKLEAHTQDNAFAPVGDAWKLLAYLVPMLAVILVCLNLLKRFHTRTGRMPGLLQSTARYAGHDRRGFSVPPAKTGILSALGGAVKKAFTSNARNQPNSAIRLIESVPIGGANVHLLEVRGRVLLLGATAGSLNVLAEFDAQSGVGSDDFRDLLHTAAADMDALDYSQLDHPNTAAVTALEGLLRETGQAVSQRSRRLRTVREVEGEDA